MTRVNRSADTSDVSHTVRRETFPVSKFHVLVSRIPVALLVSLAVAFAGWKWGRVA